ncbi:MAG: cache domain-containing protein [Rhodocyclales bacterium]|nr:cache domain-containing protein [Rhodocyclales bacterium]
MIAHIFRLALASLLFLSCHAFAEERGSADEARALAARALAHIKSVGVVKAMDDFSDAGASQWRVKDLYISAARFDGTGLAHGANPALVGRNMLELKDPNGKFMVKEMIELAKSKGAGWVDYTFLHPVTKALAPKSTYVARIPDYDGLIAVGIYK